MNRRDRLIARSRQGYRLTFGQEGPDPRRFFAAPGRVNLMGDHVDYNDGLILPCAINREIVVAASSGPEVGGRGYVEAVAIDMGQARDKIPLYEAVGQGENGWQNIVRGAVRFLQQRGYNVLPTRLAIAGDIPIGAGLSSSSSFAVAITLALAQLSRIPLAPEILAGIARDAETNFVGAEDAGLPQITSAAANLGSALLIDCRTHQYMPIPVYRDLALMIVDSGIRRQPVQTGLLQRKRECEVAAQHFGVQSLRDLTPQQLKEGAEGLDHVSYSRACHVVSEIARVEPMAVALAQGDVEVLSYIMRASHKSLCENFDVCISQVNRLVTRIDKVLSSGASPMGGVRMTGPGFGGCLVAVVHKSAVDRVKNAVEREYNSSADIPANVDVYSLAGGAREITSQ